jgi:hypothetical protein
MNWGAPSANNLTDCFPCFSVYCATCLSQTGGCYNCRENTIYTSDFTCTRCPDYTYAPSYNVLNKCIPCPRNCLTCSGSNIQYDNSVFCTSCPINTYLDKGTCLNCPPNAASLGNSYCVACPQNCYNCTYIQWLRKLLS